MELEVLNAYADQAVKIKDLERAIKGAKEELKTVQQNSVSLEVLKLCISEYYDKSGIHFKNNDAVKELHLLLFPKEAEQDETN